MDVHWIGVDLGGTKILAGLFDDNLQIKARHKIATQSLEGAPAVFMRVIEAVEAVIQMSGVERNRIRGMGIGLPGQIDPHNRVVRFAPNLDWRNLPLVPLFPANWHWPVFPENDVKLGTFGEFLHGAARGAKHVLGVFCGTGIGGGLILDGKIYNGFNFSAGEIGHTISHWRRGTELEAIAGRRSIMKRAAEMLADAPKRVRKDWKHIDINSVKSSQLAEMYQRGDSIALTLVEDAARALGAAIGGSVNLLSPEVIVIGGGLATALGESFLERIWEFATRYTLPHVTEGVRCVPATLGDDAGIVGGAAFARSHIVPVV